MKQTKRNAAIYKAYQKGELASVLAEKYGISIARIDQIVRQVAREKNKPVRPRDPRNYALRGSPLPESMLAAVRSGRLSTKEIAKLRGCTLAWVHILLRRQGVRAIDFKWRPNRERAAALYRRFMAGETARDLAREFGSTPGSVLQSLLRYRRRLGLPGKPAYGRVREYNRLARSRG